MSFLRKDRWQRAMLFVIGSVLSCGTLFGQSDSASISGFVKDPSGGVVPEAQVTLINEATGIERRTKTAENGYYVFTPVSSGVYTITAEHQGFKKSSLKQSKVDANMAATADVVLRVGEKCRNRLRS